MPAGHEPASFPIRIQSDADLAAAARGLSGSGTVLRPALTSIVAVHRSDYPETAKTSCNQQYGLRIKHLNMLTAARLKTFRAPGKGRICLQGILMVRSLGYELHGRDA